MAKPEWGIKRICLSCGARFYDLRKNPIECPSCGESFEPEAFVKTRRSRPTAPVEPAPKKPAAKPVEAEPEEVEAVADEGGSDVVEDDDEDEAVLEDASDLGEDDDVVAEVLENVDDRKQE